MSVVEVDKEWVDVINGDVATTLSESDGLVEGELDVSSSWGVVVCWPEVSDVGDITWEEGGGLGAGDEACDSSFEHHFDGVGGGVDFYL